MACYQPIRAYRKVGAYDPLTGKWPLTFRKSEGYIETAMDVPCGKCDGCRMDYARSWAMRCMHEASLHDRNCCITLTYDSEHLPPDGELDKRGMQNWLKILRNNIGSFRYFGCGEYGSKGDRPHYHIILFGYDFPDKMLTTIHGGSRHYDSQFLRELWHRGHIDVGECSYSSAAYIARYCFKKQLTAESSNHTQEEYTLKSLRPGIGAAFAEAYKDDLLANFSCVFDGKEYAIPKFYESRFSDADILALRKYRAKNLLLESPTRTAQRRQFFESKLSTLKRNYENV